MVNLVSDQYPVQSIKNCERRVMGGTQVIHITRPDQAIQEIYGKWEKQRITDRVPFSVLD